MSKPMNDSRNRNPHQRVVITGMGAITPVGNTVAETWEALKAGRSGIVPMTVLDPTPWACKISGELKGFDPHQFIPRKKARHMAAASQIAVVATARKLLTIMRAMLMSGETFNEALVSEQVVPTPRSRDRVA